MTVLSFNERVAGEVRAEMGRQRIGQHKLAGLAGWTQPYLSRRLTGRNAFSTDDLETIARALEVPLAQITGSSSDETVAS